MAGKSSPKPGKQNLKVNTRPSPLETGRGTKVESPELVRSSRAQNATHACTVMVAHGAVSDHEGTSEDSSEDGATDGGNRRGSACCDSGDSSDSDGSDA